MGSHAVWVPGDLCRARFQLWSEETHAQMASCPLGFRHEGKHPLAPLWGQPRAPPLASAWSNNDHVSLGLWSPQGHRSPANNCGLSRTEYLQRAAPNGCASSSRSGVRRGLWSTPGHSAPTGI